MVHRIAALALIGWSSLCGAEVQFESWVCYNWLDHSKAKPLVSLNGNLEMRIGSLNVAGANHVAAYSVQGLNRRWDFGLAADGTSYDFAFLIEPDGTGLYYDFTLEPTAKASQRFTCVKEK